MRIPTSTFSVLTALICAAALQLLATATLAQQTQSEWTALPEMHAKWQAWRESMKQTPLPEKAGCFAASYPGAEWQETSCEPSPLVHYSTLPADTNHANNVGSGTDKFGVVPSTNPLSSVTGSFPIATDYTTVNSYSLQVNTNLFEVPTWCAGAANPSACYGWEQFIYDEATSQLLIEYTLVNWGSYNCPSPFGHPYVVQGSNGWIACYVNTPITSVPGQPLANLPYMELMGEVSGTLNEAILWTGNGNLYATTNNDLFGTALAQNWTSAEFGVFGANSDSPEAIFNTGATFVVEEGLNNGTTALPQCYSSSGFSTTEYNNLNLVPNCCPYGGTSPSIQFMESNASGATATCGANGLQGNFAATPYIINAQQNDGSQWVFYTVTVGDSTPSATIYYSLPACGLNYFPSSGSVSSGGSFNWVAPYSCGPEVTMYATAPGYVASLAVTDYF